MRVLLVHGLWRTPLSLTVLARRLRRLGLRPAQFSYAAVAQSYDGIVRRLTETLDRLGDEGEYAVVAHSLGGLLLRSAFPHLSGPLPRHLVMLGTPNRLPRLARTCEALWPYRWLTGECGARLASPAFYSGLPEPPIPYALVAGTRGIVGRWSPFGYEPNDGIVAVSETLIRGDEPVVLLPATHTFLMNQAEVVTVVRRALGGSGSAVAPPVGR